MANENEVINLALPTDAISVAMSEAFVVRAIGLPLVYTESFAPNTNVLKFRKKGSVTAQTVGEGANYTVDANSELSDASVSCTAEKKVMSTTHTVEQQRFGGQMGQLSRYITEHAAAHARLFDSDLKTLFSSFTNNVTATSTLTKDDILDGRYNVVSNMKGAFSGNLVAMIDHKGANELDKELSDTAATVFANQQNLGILGTAPQGTPKGELFGIQVYETDGLPTDVSDDVGAIFDPSACFAAGVDGSNGFYSEVRFTGNQGLHYELTTWTYFKIVLWNNTAGCGIKSDT